MLTTTFSVLLILIGSLLDLPSCASHAAHPPFRPSSYFLSIGIFFFAFGGHGVFPTIQHDMRRPRQFSRSSALGFLSRMGQ
jgi:amino acid permease